jgi:hypothetical protein
LIFYFFTWMFSFLYHCQYFYRSWLSIWVTRRVFFGRICVAHFASFLCCSIMCFYVLSSVLWCPLRFPYTNDVWSLPPVVCSSAHVLFTLFVFAYVYWCPTHTVLCFCFVFLRLVYPMLPFFLDWPFLIVFSVSSNLYLQMSSLI